MNGIEYGLLGKRIHSARKKMGLTQAELGERVGVSDSHISHIENGKAKPSLKMILAIFSVLNISPAEGLSEQIDNDKASRTYSEELASRIHALPIEEQHLLTHLIESLEKTKF